MPTYDSAIALAARLIAKQGGPAVLKRHTPGTVDPVTQTETGAADATAAIRAVGLPTGKSAEKIVGTLVGRKLQTFYIAGKGMAFQPAPDDLIAWKGEDWKLIACTTYDPAADGTIFTEAIAEI